ncbi:hypothetical protein ACCO45_002765 [Purpureocillium lilacinum]|uniref:Uncharacterized protein n=1 Tax=Purpureocillium lilacinum TaxID=33203 RepID=A0ACC4DYW7_PURLI
MKTPFSIAANPDTDVWKKPPTHDVFNGAPLPHPLPPAHHRLPLRLPHLHLPYATQFDQAGLLLVFHPPSSHLPFPANNIKSPTDVPAHRKWIKAGVEFFDGAPRLSTVCCDNWADWSVASLPTTTTATPSSADADQALAEIVAGQRPVTITIAKETSSNGSCLWVHYVDPATGAKTPMREINWPYGEPAGPGWELEVAAAVARPAKSTTDKLEATFTEFDVKWA